MHHGPPAAGGRGDGRRPLGAFLGSFAGLPQTVYSADFLRLYAL